MSLAAVSILVALSISTINLRPSGLKLKAFVALFVVSLFLALATLRASTVVKAIKEGFTNIWASVGFIIIFGAMIGITVDRTGATMSIASFSWPDIKTKLRVCSSSLQVMGLVVFEFVWLSSLFLL